MNRFIFIIGLVLFSSLHLVAQQLPLHSQYVENGFLYNPAMAGSKPYSPLRLNVRNQWLGVENAPSTQALSFNKNLTNSSSECKISGAPFHARRNLNPGIGIGAYLFNDNQGAVSRTGIELSYAYHIQLTRKNIRKNGTRLAFGLGAMFYQHKFDVSSLPLNDPVSALGNEVSFVPDAKVGIYLYSDDFFLGLSLAHLLESSVVLGQTNISDTQIDRHMFLNGGVTLHPSKTVDVEPSFILRKTLNSDLYWEGTAKVYVRSFWMGASYRSNNQCVGLIGLSFLNYYIGYSYDYFIGSSIASSSYGTHEISLGINFDIGKDAIRKWNVRDSRKSTNAYRRKIKTRKKRSRKTSMFL